MQLPELAIAILTPHEIVIEPTALRKTVLHTERIYRDERAVCSRCRRARLCIQNI